MSKECPDPRRTQFLDIFLPCFAYWSLLLSWNSVQRMPVTSLSQYKTDVRGQSRHINIWHIHNFSVARSPILPAGYPDENVYVPWAPRTEPNTTSCWQLDASCSLLTVELLFLLCVRQSPPTGAVRKLSKSVNACFDTFWRLLPSKVSKAVKVCLAAPTVRKKNRPIGKIKKPKKATSRASVNEH